MVHRAHRAMTGGIDRLRAGGLPAAGGYAAPAARDDGAFTSLLSSNDAAGPTASREAAPPRGAAWLQANVADIFARTAQDRQARRHGKALLQALAGLQRAALGGNDDQAQAALATLARTLQDEHEADDPVLRLILREIGVRAAVEMARAGPPA